MWVKYETAGKLTSFLYFNAPDDDQTGKLEEIARGNPQWPQAFYGMERVFDVENDDWLFARCTFDSSGRNRTTHIGATSDDEMCNLYLMYYTDAATGSSYGSCFEVISCNAPDSICKCRYTPGNFGKIYVEIKKKNIYFSSWQLNEPTEELDHFQQVPYIELKIWVFFP